jgi:hypothetical protein
MVGSFSILSFTGASGLLLVYELLAVCCSTPVVVWLRAVFGCRDVVLKRIEVIR